MPELSVIMPTYNEDIEALKTCVQSVLQQTFSEFEFLIVVEPGEKNLFFLEDLAIADSRVTIIANEVKLGVSESRNRALSVSTGKYVSLIDGDDYCDVTRFEKQIAFLEFHPDVSLVGSNMSLIDENNHIIGERNYPETFDEIKNRFLYTMTVANPTVTVRRKDIEDIGFYDSEFTKAEDFELWLRFLANHKKMHNLQEKLVYYRTPTNQNEKRGRVHWQNNYIARKRYSKLIWPIHKRMGSLLMYFMICNMPNGLIDRLMNMTMLSKFRNITMNYVRC